ncbi:MAG: DHHA1 domain-containing protein, partial [Pseudomonadota bacterium]|nr:DHHA1 domain-containing protein [Pseudomonadota bacterium]
AQDVGGIKVLAARLEGFDMKALRDAMDRLKQQLGDAVIVLAGANGGKVALVAAVCGRAVGRIPAGQLLADVAGRINGKAGGRAEMAQGGGDDGPELAAALASVQGWVEDNIREP